jgi:hypothetical protein
MRRAASMTDRPPTPESKKPIGAVNGYTLSCFSSMTFQGDYTPNHDPVHPAVLIYSQESALMNKKNRASRNSSPIVSIILTGYWKYKVFLF